MVAHPREELARLASARVMILPRRDDDLEAERDAECHELAAAQAALYRQMYGGSARKPMPPGACPCRQCGGTGRGFDPADYVRGDRSSFPTCGRCGGDGWL